MTKDWHGDYEKYKEKRAGDIRKLSAAGRDIGPMPAVVNPERRKKTTALLSNFYKEYFPETFTLPSCKAQNESTKIIERVIVDGGLFALAEPRGFGKTTRIARAALWALLTERRKFCMIITATEGLSQGILDICRKELQFNKLLLEDFPEVCYPIAALENQTKRQSGQTSEGEPTLLRLASDEIIFPSVAGSPVSGSVLRTVGITGAVRGQLVTTRDGKTLRPDLVLIDDPQTRESSKSPTQTDEREALVNGDILGLSGPGQKIAALMCCTVIYDGDLADRFIDRERNPAWGGRRVKLLPEMPTNLDLWDEYAEIRRQSLRDYGDNRAGNAFYKKNKRKMDLGAVAVWPERFNPDELSAVQHAMNIRIDRPKAFNSEYQNEPDPSDLGAVDDLTQLELQGKLSKLPRHTPPHESTRITAFVDVGGSIHWYCVCAWDDHFGGSVIDYGTFPRQNRAVFASSDIRPTLQQAFPGQPDETAIVKGLEAITEELTSRRYSLADGSASLAVDRILIDSGFQTELVYQFCRNLRSPIITPSKGFAIGPNRAPMSEWTRKPGERHGESWRLAPTNGTRLLVFDPNYWKSFVTQRIKTPVGVRGCLGVFGRPDEVHTHQLFFEHLLSEYRTRVAGRGRQIDVWDVRPDRTDNHWWDCLVGCAVAASLQGVVWKAAEGNGSQASGKRRRSMAAERQQKRGDS